MSTKITDLLGAKVTPIHRGSVLLSKHVEPAVNRQPGFRRGLVEQIISFTIDAQIFLHGELLKCKLPNPGVFIQNFHENSKIS